jgi:hypothetical protein
MMAPKDRGAFATVTCSSMWSGSHQTAGSAAASAAIPATSDPAQGEPSRAKALVFSV